MDALLVICRLLLALVFTVAGIAKLVSRQSTREMLEGFGFPTAFIPISSILLPACELLVACGLFATLFARAGAAAALALLGAFSIGIAINLHFGRRPSCQCFGQLAASPVSYRTILRNLLLMTLAAVVLWKPSNYVALALPAQQLALLLAIVGSCLGALAIFLLFQLTAQNGRILLALEELAGRQPASSPTSSLSDSASPAIHTGVGLPIGARAPLFQLPDFSGRRLSLADLLRSGSPLLLTFVDPGCGPCHALMPSLERWQQESPLQKFILISRGTAAENTGRTAHGIPVLLQTDREVQEHYQALGTPSMLHINPEGTIGSGVAQGSDQIRALVSALRSITPSNGGSTAQKLPAQGSPAGATPCPDCGRIHSPNHMPAQPGPRSILQPGAPLPAELSLKLRDAGTDLALYQGKPLLLLFWSSACGFCQAMLPDLKRWETTRSPTDPQLFIIESAAAPPTNGNFLHSPGIRDESFQIGRAFSIGGTPSAILLAPDGTIASEIAIGSSAIMKLVSPAPAARS